MKTLLQGTPRWFQQFIIPMVIAVPITVSATLAWSDTADSIDDIERDLARIQIIIDELEKRGDLTKEQMQSLVTTQAVMDAKLDMIVTWIEKQE